MSLEKLQNQLIQSARRAPVNDRVPLGFEKRVMNRLYGEKGYGNRLSQMARGMWAACAPAIVLAIVAFFLSQPVNQSIPADLALENAVMSPLMAENEIW